MSKYRVRRTIERDCCSGLFFYWVRLQKQIGFLPFHHTIKTKSGCTYDRFEAIQMTAEYREELMDDYAEMVKAQEAKENTQGYVTVAAAA